MEQITSFEFTGTAADFEKACVTLNGKPLDKITVGNLAKHAIIADAGTVEKVAGRRGPVAKKFRAVSRPGLVFGISEDCKSELNDSDDFNPTGEVKQYPVAVVPGAASWPFPTKNARPDEESPI